MRLDSTVIDLINIYQCDTHLNHLSDGPRGYTAQVGVEGFILDDAKLGEYLVQVPVRHLDALEMTAMSGLVTHLSYQGGQRTTLGSNHRQLPAWPSRS